MNQPHNLINDKGLIDIVLQRKAVPKCEELKQRILIETNTLRQETKSLTFYRKLNNMSYRVKLLTKEGLSLQPQFAMTVATLAIVSVMILTFNNPLVNSVEPMDQMAWDDLLLMQDEFDFANL